MKKYLLNLSCIIFVLISVLINPSFIYSSDIVGVWKSEFDTQIGVQKYTFKFKQDTSGLTGIAISDIDGNIQEVILTEVKLDSKKISFVEMLPFQDMELRISYEGVVSGNEMKLNRNVSEFVTEEIVAKREETTK